MNVKRNDGTLAMETWAPDARARTLRDAMRAGRTKCETAHEEISRLHRERLPTLTVIVVKMKFTVCVSLALVQRNEHKANEHVLGDLVLRVMMAKIMKKVKTATRATRATRNFKISWEPEEHILQKKLIEDYRKGRGPQRG